MNSRTKLIVSLLFIVLIILAAAITHFYSSVPSGTEGGGVQTDSLRKLESDPSGYRIIEDSSGLCGIIDPGGRIAAAPEWVSLSFAGSERCIGSKMVNGKLLSGCTDFDGNIIVPLIYRSISEYTSNGSRFYVAEAAADGQFVIYNSSFDPIFRRSWSGAEVNDNVLTLVDAAGIYNYSINDSGKMAMQTAKVSGETLGRSYTLEVTSKILLSTLDPEMIEEMVNDAGKYLEFAFTGNDDLLSELTTGGRGGFRQLFPDDHSIISKNLMGVTGISLYAQKADDGTDGYAVSITADTDITYSDGADGETKKLRGNYTAVVDFTGTSVNDISSQSGSFLQEKPDYPDKAAEELTDLQ